MDGFYSMKHAKLIARLDIDKLSSESKTKSMEKNSNFFCFCVKKLDL